MAMVSIRSSSVSDAQLGEGGKRHQRSETSQTVGDTFFTSHYHRDTPYSQQEQRSRVIRGLRRPLTTRLRHDTCNRILIISKYSCLHYNNVRVHVIRYVCM